MDMALTIPLPDKAIETIDAFAVAPWEQSLVQIEVWIFMDRSTKKCNGQSTRMTE